MDNIDEAQPYFQADSHTPLNAIELFGGKELKTWTTKALPHPVLAVNIVMGAVCILPISMVLYGYFGDQTIIGEFPLLGCGIFTLCLCCFSGKRVPFKKTFIKTASQRWGAGELLGRHPGKHGCFLQVDGRYKRIHHRLHDRSHALCDSVAGWSRRHGYFGLEVSSKMEKRDQLRPF